MANKRTFKKYISAVGASICDEMMITYYNVDGANKEEIANAIEKVLLAITNAKNNANLYFDRGPKGYDNLKDYSKAKEDFFKALFDKIVNSFTKEIDSAIKQFNAAIPDEVKASNKNCIA